MVELQEVFKTNGVPTVTFVKPLEYPKIILNLRTAGRGLVIEGPSGIGKTTAVLKAIEELGFSDRVVRLSARKKDDVEYISILSELKDFGIVLIDDFHKLSDDVKSEIANLVKINADEEVHKSKLIVIGINEAGNSLIKFAKDLVNRIDIIRFTNSTDMKITELVEKGEKELNINLNIKDEIVKEANGGFYIAQMLCNEMCLKENILETLADFREINTSFESVKFIIWKRLSDTFYEVCKSFALGTRYRPDGRAPYLHLLNWLASSGDWVLNLQDAMRNHPEMKLSVGQVVEQKFLNQLFQKNEQLSTVLHFDGINLVVEDPQFIFYIRNMPWAKFAKDLGFKNIEFKNKYDFALSFAGSEREFAEKLFEQLCDEELNVFYDKNEEHRIVAANIDEYLEPIYQSEATFIICLLSNEYPKRIWTVFEAKNFASRIQDGQIIPILFDGTTIDVFSSLSKIGYLPFNRVSHIEPQLKHIVSVVKKKYCGE